MARVETARPVVLFTPREWAKANALFRDAGQLYQDAPRSKAYARKARTMFDHFPSWAGIEVQAAYLAKNLVNLQRWPDANKRTAALLLEVFLEKNGHRLMATDQAFRTFLVDVQRRVPPEWWDGRTFSLRPDRIAWANDEYHQRLADWFTERLVPTL